MALNDNSNSGMSATSEASTLQIRQTSTLPGAPLTFGPTLQGTGFETLPPLVISANLFKFLISLGLKSIGLGLDCILFHEGWELTVWEPCLFDVELHASELLEICEEVEIEDPIEVVGPQIELDLRVGSSIYDDKPPVEVPGVVPTVEVEEEDSSVEVLVSGKEMKRDQAEGTGTEPVPEDAELRMGGQFVGTREPVLEGDRSGEQPDLMEVDQTG